MGYRYEAPADGGFITADNGLTASTATNVQLGGTLIQNTRIDCGAFTFIIDNRAGVAIGDIAGTGNGTILRIADASFGVFVENRFSLDKGANVAAANDLTLGGDGNSFVITGNTQINAITILNWQIGAVVILSFTGTPTVKNNTAGGAGTVPLLLEGGVDFVASAGATLTLWYDGTNWQQTAGTSLTAGFVQTADNGLTLSTPTNVQLGGALVANTSIGSGAFTFDIDGTAAISIGDVTGAGANTLFVVDDTAMSISALVNGNFDITDGAGGLWFTVNVPFGTTGMGDLLAGFNNTNFVIDDANTTILAQVNGIFKVQDVASAMWLQVDTINTIVSLGDVSATGNSTLFIVNDAIQQITANTAGVFQVQDSTGAELWLNVAVPNRAVSFGDLSSVLNGTVVYLDDNAMSIIANTAGVFEVQDSTGIELWLQADVANRTVSLGDINITNNGVQLALSDVLQVIDIRAARLLQAMGGSVAAANDLTLDPDGNSFIITGNTTINAIDITNWSAGSRITLEFTGTPTVKNNTAGGSPAFASMLLAGNTDLSAAANTVLGLYFNGTVWQETFRKVA